MLRCCFRLEGLDADRLYYLMVVDGAGLGKFPLDAKVAHSAIRKEPGCLLLLSTAILKLSSPLFIKFVKGD